MGIHLLPERDNSGRPINRQAATIKGWHYQYKEIEISLSKLDGAKSYKGGQLLTDVSCKIYDTNDNEITDQANEGNAVRTKVTLMLAHDYEILGGKIHQPVKPVNDIRMSVFGGPTALGDAYCKYFVPSLNLSLMPASLPMDTDGRASKFMALNTDGVPVETNRFSSLLQRCSNSSDFDARL